MDKIAEMLTKIRNASLAGHEDVTVGFSGFKLNLAKILEREGFVKSAFGDKNNARKIRIILKYNKVSGAKKIPAIGGIRKISQSGQRVYIKNKDIKSVRNNFGKAIFSTSKGIMTGEETKKTGLGGEYICEIW